MLKKTISLKIFFLKNGKVQEFQKKIIIFSEKSQRPGISKKNLKNRKVQEKGRNFKKKKSEKWQNPGFLKKKNYFF